jgi:hypothetical protein
MDLTYCGDARRPDDTSPFPIPGFPAPLPIGEPYDVTDDFAQGHFNCTAPQLVERICTRYNAGYDDAPRFEASATTPSTKATKATKPASSTPQAEPTPEPSTENTPPEPAKE